MEGESVFFYQKVDFDLVQRREGKVTGKLTDGLDAFGDAPRVVERTFLDDLEVSRFLDACGGVLNGTG